MKKARILLQANFGVTSGKGNIVDISKSYSNLLLNKTINIKVFYYSFFLMFVLLRGNI
jgi:hypothetical protein